jgi:hypothetical protein
MYSSLNRRVLQCRSPAESLTVIMGQQLPVYPFTSLEGLQKCFSKDIRQVSNFVLVTSIYKQPCKPL